VSAAIPTTSDAAAALDHLAVKIPIQVVPERLGRRIAPAGLFAQALEADGLEVSRHARNQLRGSHQFVVDNLPNRLDGRFALERGAAGEHLVQDGAEGIDISRRPDVPRMPPGLLRGHVAWRAHDLAGHRVAIVRIGQLGQSEIRDLDDSVERVEHVGRLEITVDDTCQVRHVNGPGQ
jgi:hypothetical protein